MKVEEKNETNQNEPNKPELVTLDQKIIEEKTENKENKDEK